jgi:signal transduction histidine kinase
MNRSAFSVVRPFLIAVALVAAAAVVRVILEPLVSGHPYSIFVLAVLAAARLQGSRAAILTSILSAPVAHYFFVSPRHSILIAGQDQWISLALFLISGAIIVYLMYSEEQTRRRLEASVVELRSIDDELRKRDSQLSGILDNTTAVIFVKDAESRFMLTNRRHQELFQDGSTRFTGKRTEEAYPAEIARRLLESDALVWRHQHAIDFEEVVPQRDGLHTYRSIKFPIRDKAGKMVALGAISTDISDLKAANDALNEQQALLRDLIAVQEQEKQFLCNEFHDGLIQQAVGSLMLLESCRDESELAVCAPQIETAINSLRRGIDDGRRVIRGLRPAVLDDSGLQAAIDDLVGQFNTSGIHITCKCDPQIGRLSDSIQTTVYRVVQEALNNAKKYSGTDVVRIDVLRHNEELRVEVRDFGCGFDVDSARVKGFGLRGMAERVRLIGGDFTIESEHDVGTRIFVRVPIGNGF